MLLRVTVVRVFPTCDVLGTFRVRGRAGVNRVPFHGRLHGRPLPTGTYRLVIGARRVQPLEATIVVARGKVNAGKLRKARRANACVPVLPIGFDSAAPSFGTSGAAGGGPSNGGLGPAIVSGAKGAVKQGKSLVGGAKEALEDPAALSTLVLVAIGLLTLIAAALGAFVLGNIYRLRERFYR